MSLMRAVLYLLFFSDIMKKKFVKYYKERLASLGFIKVKGRQPYFVRVVNDEILHILTLDTGMSAKDGYKVAHLECGIATVYRQEINFSVTPKHNNDWLVDYTKFFRKKNFSNQVIEYPRDLKMYYYKEETMDEIIGEMWIGISDMIKEFDNVQNMENTLNWLMRYNPGNIIQSDWSLTDDCIAEESLYYLRKKFPLSAFQQNFEELKNEVINSPLVGDEKEKELKEVKEWENELYKDRAEMQINQQNYEQGMQLLREHYDRNVEYLNGIGIAVERRDITDLFD